MLAASQPLASSQTGEGGCSIGCRSFGSSRSGDDRGSALVQVELVISAAARRPASGMRPSHRPSWARWNGDAGPRYTLGAEEEVMLLDPHGGSLAQSSDDVLGRLPAALAAHAAPETHASVIELQTGIHAHTGGAVDELAALRAQLAHELTAMGLRAACAGTLPACRSAGSARVRVCALQPGRRVDAHARAERADARTARARGAAGSRGSGSGAQRPSEPRFRCCSRCRRTPHSARDETPGSPRRAP